LYCPSVVDGTPQANRELTKRRFRLPKPSENPDDFSGLNNNNADVEEKEVILVKQEASLDWTFRVTPEQR
jgi:hypothetical protein